MNLIVADKRMKVKLTPVSKPYVCQYCGSAYVKESTLVVHMCEQKRRHLAKNEKHVQLAYQAYVRFFQLSQKAKNTKSYEEFAKSPYYNAFVKFGSFLSNVDPLYLDRYIDYVVTSGIKLDHWCKEDLYYAYVLDLVKKEPAEVALQRCVSTMIDWAEKNNSQWNHYFKYVNTNRAVYDLKDGKMSPWLVLNCDTGRNMLNKFNDEQLGIIFEVLNPDFWSKRFRMYPADLEFVKQIVKEGNL